MWLKENNPLYGSITIDMTRIDSLPVDVLEIPDIIVDAREYCALDIGPVENKVHNEQIETSSFLPSSHTHQTQGIRSP